MIECFRVKFYARSIKLMEGHSRRNWNTGSTEDMPGKSLNEWNCTLE
jgi:hypothetical protein